MPAVYVPWILYVIALICALSFHHLAFFWPEFLKYLVLFCGGLQCLWFAYLHLVQPKKIAKLTGWTDSSFQKEVAVYNIAIGLVALVSYIKIMWLIPVAVILAIIYAFGIAIHYRAFKKNKTKAAACHGSLFCSSLVLAVSLFAAIYFTVY